MKKLLFTSFILIIFLSVDPKAENEAKSGKIEVVTLGTKDKYQFKGMSIDTTNQKVYLASYDKKELVVVSLKDNTHQVIRTDYSGKKMVVGTYLKGETLYALMTALHNDTETHPISALVMIDSKTLQVTRQYEVAASSSDDKRIYFNHVVVSSNGIAYVSDTINSAIYSVDTNNQNAQLNKFLFSKKLSWIHGIDLSPDGSSLFFNSYASGLGVIKLKNKEITLLNESGFKNSDGLKYYQGSLYGIGHSALTKYELNKQQDHVEKTERLIFNHEFFNDPRDLHIENGWITILANIKLNAADFGNNKSAIGRPLDDTYLLKYRL